MEDEPSKAEPTDCTTRLVDDSASSDPTTKLEDGRVANGRTARSGFGPDESDRAADRVAYADVEPGEPDRTVRMPRPSEAPEREPEGVGPVTFAGRGYAPGDGYGTDDALGSVGGPGAGGSNGTSRRGARNPYKALSVVLGLLLVAVVAFMVGGYVGGSAAPTAPTTPVAPHDEDSSSSPSGPLVGHSAEDKDETGGSAGDESGDSGDDTLGSLAQDLADKIGSVDVDDVTQKLSEGADKLTELSKDLASGASDLLDQYANS